MRSTWLPSHSSSVMPEYLCGRDPGKMVDFVICIDTTGEDPCGPVMNAIKHVREMIPTSYISHCSSLGFRDSPLCVAIESKRQGYGGLESLL